MVCDLWLVVFDPFLCVSVFQGSLLVIVILLWLTAAKNAIVKAAFEIY